MKISKVNGSFNEYRLELSWGELEAVYQSMSHNHSGPIADEVFDGLTWYMNDNLPLPGEEKEKKDSKKQDGDAELDALLPDPDAMAHDLDDEPAPVDPARLPAAEPPAGPPAEEEVDDDTENDADLKLPKPPED